ncbi:hypothetical protein SEA_BING_65 [Streptomyces phage Bing]|uniref:Uncharacterized protein n=1 Tax=Streptomyces phage Bing TaxID=2079427 RepID=A0A2L1IWC2_9CAUD|nr:hypothetical protein FDJ31_gp65 [Streptomyces phage Bing]AVD99487.1 hypothetical protein SEA_BING_65 [Streptomyces phage Bing]
MSRNVFENNQPETSQEDSRAVGDSPHILLPPLAEGYHYELLRLPSGRMAVVTVGP